MKEVTGNAELLSDVQELKSKLEDSEQEKMALHYKLKTCQEQEGRACQEKDRACQEIVSLKKERLSMLSSQVRRLEGLRHQANH